jgi:hypothetical protein
MPCSAPSCCAPSFGCGGFGGPVPIFLGRTSPTGSYQPGPEDKFGARLRITCNLPGSKVVLPVNTVESFLAKHVRALEHQVEVNTPSIFVERLGRFFGRTGAEKVIGVWPDGEATSLIGNSGQELGNLQSAIATAADKLVSLSHVNQVKVEASGKTADFEMHQILLYRFVHEVGGPAIYFDVLALPLEWSKKEDEDELDYMQRIDEVLADKSVVEAKNREATAKMEGLVGSYESLLSSIFYATNFRFELKVDFSKIVV